MTDATPLPAPVRPKFYITTVGKNLNGSPVAVGWDFCGKCDKHINNCTCTGGVPTEPIYVTNMRKREEEATRVKAAEKALPTDVASNPVAATSSPAAEPRVPLATAGPGAGPACVICGIGTSIRTADQNDDGSWTHHDCQ